MSEREKDDGPLVRVHCSECDWTTEIVKGAAAWCDCGRRMEPVKKRKARRRPRAYQLKLREKRKGS